VIYRNRGNHMISAIFRWQGRHPKACLIPVAMLALLTSAQLLAYHYGEEFIPEPFFVAAGLWLVLATVASLGVARAWWLRNQVMAELARTRAEFATHIAHTQALIEAYRPHRWNAATQSSRVYGRPKVVGTRDFDDVVQVHFDEPDTGPLDVAS
jgi:hypothetical protein